MPFLGSGDPAERRSIMREGSMSSVIPLGRFDRIRLREAWPNESNHFTPWLALPENLKVLAEALGLGELQNPLTEVSVGDFLIDIIATDGDGEAVLIENQLEQTDHRHLGQLLTYLAGQERRATVVWIAENFRDEHRAAIDWLNRNTGDGFSFFGVEVELWRIGDSVPAPRFKPIAKPNPLAEKLREVTDEASDPELLDRHRIRLAYWQSFGDFLRAQNANFIIRRPTKNDMYRFRPERAGFRIVAGISIRRQRATVGLTISRDPDRSRYRALLAEQTAIQGEFAEALSWNENPGAKRSLIAISHQPFNPADAAQYPDTHRWMLESMERFRAVFGPRIAALPVGPLEPEDDEADD
jgi:hypothetical protein